MKSLLWSSGRILNIVITNPDFLQTGRYPYLLYLIVVYFGCSLVIVPTVLRKVTTFLLSKVMITIFSPKCSCNFLYISPRPACTVSAHSSFLTLQACYCSPVHHIYVFKKHCFPRGRPVKCDGRKRGYDVILVRTKDFEYKIQQICKVRNDEWAETVRGRLEFAQDLHAADAVYHQACSVNFRTRKQIPKKHENDTDSKPAKGRPTNKVKSKAFLKRNRGSCREWQGTIHNIWSR